MDLLARTLGIRLAADGELDWGVGDAFGVAVLLGKPKTFMNLSGAAVAPVYRRFAGSPGDLIVVHDDLDIATGLVRLKRGGGTAGHNGLRSLQENLGTRDFLRARIGIGRPPEGVDPADFVLSPVPDESRAPFESGVASAAQAVLDVVRDGFDRAMTRCNASRVPSPSGNSGGRDT